MDSTQEKAQIVGQIIGYVIGIGIAVVIACIFTIEMGYEYGWFAGGFHGAWVPINWVRSLFDSSIMTKADVHTSGYTVWWWIGLVLTCWFYLVVVLNLIGGIRRLMR